MIKILSVILFFLFLFVGGKRGVKTFITFYLSILLIFLYLLLMNIGLNAIVLAIIICILASIISLFILNGYNLKTKSSFISIMLVLIFIFTIVYIIGKEANIQGFSMESIESIGGYSYNINYDMTNVIIGMYLVCIIGTVIDTSISISSAMNEIYENNPHIDDHSLFKSGLNIGNDILSTTISTLYFALVSSFIGFFMWHKGANLAYIINYKIFAQDIIQLLISFIGSILIIPITAYISSKILLKKSLIS